MKALKAVAVFAATLGLVAGGAFFSGGAHAEAKGGAPAAEGAKAMEGAKPKEAPVPIKWTVNVNPGKNTVDLHLVNSKTGKPVANAVVKAVVTMPDGQKVEKEMKKMKMGKEISYMGTVYMSLKGVYQFDVSVTIGKAKNAFQFQHEVK